MSKPARLILLSFLIAIIVGCSQLSPTNPFDPEAPESLQKQAVVTGSVLLPREYESINRREVQVKVRALTSDAPPTATEADAITGTFELAAPASGNVLLSIELEGFYPLQLSLNLEIGSRVDIGEVILRPDLVRLTARVEKEGEVTHDGVVATVRLGAEPLDESLSAASGEFQLLVPKRRVELFLRHPEYVGQTVEVRWVDGTFYAGDERLQGSASSPFRLSRTLEELRLELPETTAPGGRVPLDTVGGRTPYAYELVDSMDPETRIEGDTLNIGPLGRQAVTVVVNDSAGQSSTATIQVSPAISTKLADRRFVSAGTSTSFEVIGGVRPYTAEVVGGDLDDRIDQSTFELTVGKRTRRLFGVRFTDANGQTTTNEVVVGMSQYLGRSPLVVRNARLSTSDRPEFMAALVNDQRVALGSADKNGDLQELRTFEVQGYPTNLSSFDFDEDGLDEIVVVTAQPNAVRLYRHDAARGDTTQVLALPSLEKASAVQVTRNGGAHLIVVGFEGQSGIQAFEVVSLGGVLETSRVWTLPLQQTVSDLEIVHELADNVHLLVATKGSSSNAVLTIDLNLREPTQNRIVDSYDVCPAPLEPTIIPHHGDDPDLFTASVLCVGQEGEFGQLSVRDDLSIVVESNQRIPDDSDGSVGNGELCSPCGRPGDRACDSGLCGSFDPDSDYLTCRESCEDTMTSADCPPGYKCVAGFRVAETPTTVKACSYFADEYPVQVCHRASDTAFNGKIVAASYRNDPVRGDYLDVLSSTGHIGSLTMSAAKSSLLGPVRAVPSGKSGALLSGRSAGEPETFAAVDFGSGTIAFVRHVAGLFDAPVQIYPALDLRRVKTLTSTDPETCPIYGAACLAGTTVFGCFRPGGRFDKELVVPTSAACPVAVGTKWLASFSTKFLVVDPVQNSRKSEFGNSTRSAIVDASEIEVQGQALALFKVALSASSSEYDIVLGSWQTNGQYGFRWNNEAKVVEARNSVSSAPGDFRYAKFLGGQDPVGSFRVITHWETSSAGLISSNVRVVEFGTDLRGEVLLDTSLPGKSDPLVTFDCNQDDIFDFGIGLFRQGQEIALWESSQGGFRQIDSLSLAGPERPASYLHWAAGDINGDGLVDVVASESLRNELIVFLGTGNCRFAQPTRSSLPGRLFQFELVDATADGRLDVVGMLDGSMVLLRNRGSNEYTFEGETRWSVDDQACVTDEQCGDNDDDCGATKGRQFFCTRDCKNGRACPQNQTCVAQPGRVPQCIPDGKMPKERP